MDNKKWKAFLNEEVRVKVRGYVRPANQFHTLATWESAVNQMLALQAEGMSVRGGVITVDPTKPVQSEKWLKLINHFFGYLLTVEAERFSLTEKNVLDFIEDFINHRFWSMRTQYQSYFPNIESLRFAFLFSRGDIEPYVMVDDVFTTQFYGSDYNVRQVKHYTSQLGLKKILSSIENQEDFDVSTFTMMSSPFFRDESNLILTLEANVRAAFRSDVKSLALNNGRRAVNLHRLDYPGPDTNICLSIDSCDGELKTSLWNEIIATPLKILNISIAEEEDVVVLKEVEKYQRKVRARHNKMKKRLIGMGGAKNTTPYVKKPSMKRSKSAPAGFGGS